MGGVLVVVVFPLLAIMVCVLIGRRRRKKKDHQMYSVTAHKDLYTFTAGTCSIPRGIARERNACSRACVCGLRARNVLLSHAL